MALYILSYDLCKEKDYQKLYDELEKFHAVRILESDWCFYRDYTNAVALRDHFLKFIDDDDRLFVAAITEWASHKTLATPKDIK